MDKQRRLQKFSIRKYTVGACSILVGTLIFLSSPTHHAFASENTVDATKLEVTEKEKEIVRRGRNAENHHLPKNANVQDYMYATAFEALIGYLYLTKQEERLKEILEKCVK